MMAVAMLDMPRGEVDLDRNGRQREREAMGGHDER